ncbi:MAG TPA: cyclic nucleotide-binding domain-containing protein [Thermoanaerobaculia bacterium]|jgi:CRP-like cAMP-binding protein|nr:cyclic nucleotide-binding domain-containing protein [Thermoanaerobaculia bacterium]
MTGFLDLLSARTDSEVFQPGEPIYLQGEPGSLLFVLLAGEVDLDIAGETVGSVGPGEVFGEGALLGEPKRATTARARTAVRVAPVGPALYQVLAQRAPEIAAAVLEARRRHSNDSKGDMG